MNPKKRPFNYMDDDEGYDSLYPVASNTDCTGLCPFAVKDEEQEESYKEIQDIPFAHDKDLVDNNVEEGFQ